METTLNNNQDNIQTLRIVPHLDTGGHALVFPIMEYSLDGSQVIKIGRCITDRRVISKTQMTFKSKVVSRRHAEIFLKDGKVYLRDIQSSSGTFLNSRRLCAPNTLSSPFEVHDNDIVQLGVDYQGGHEEIYRCVKMRVELNRQPSSTSNSAYNLKTLNSLRNLTTPPNYQQTAFLNQPRGSYTSSQGGIIKGDDNTSDTQSDECAICLGMIRRNQAIFISPCGHYYHYICIFPLLQNHPGFLCPICRTYSDLTASVDMEAEEEEIASSWNRQVISSSSSSNHHQDDLLHQGSSNEASNDITRMMISVRTTTEAAPIPNSTICRFSHLE